jgi:hypothetical protein
VHEEAREATAWYDELREQYRPARLKVLLVAESPPDPGAGERRFFYSPVLTYDNLYRGVAEALYGADSSVVMEDKPATLERMVRDGYWLIDAVEEPTNKRSQSQRRAAIRSAVPRLAERCRELRPERGIVICHGVVYDLVVPALRNAGLHVLHDKPLPFPLGNWRAQFVAGFRQAVT